MTWEDVIKEEKRFRAGQRRSARVEYMKNEFDNDVETLEEILSDLPVNMFHDLVRDFKELIKKYEKFDGAGRLK